MLADVGGGDEDVIDAVRDKLRAVAGGGDVPAGSRVAFVPVEDVKDKVAGLRDALSRGRRVHLRYYVPSRDEATERDVDPMQLLVADGRAYLEVWCRRADDVRLFRLDRVLDLTVLDVPADVPQEAHQQARDVDAGLFRASPDDALVVLQVSALARWVAEYYPTESAVPITDGPFAGGLLVTLRASDTGWLRRLALRLGENARVLSPPELAASIRSTASAALANYDQ
jgi:proteasome accessory factor C